MSYASDALIDAQEREIKKLESENEKLDSENASLRGAVQGLGELCDRYKTENARLREMVHMAEVCMSYPHCVEKCRYHYVKDGYWECEYQDLKDELGI